MQYLVVDLEWNGAYSRRAHGYFNEIIEIGAVRMDGQMRQRNAFHAVLRPEVSRRLSGVVRELTSITPEELEDGVTFEEAITALRQWTGEEPATLLTWSTTDLAVLREDLRFFYGEDRIPFAQYYADLQAYVQAKTGLGSRGRQLGLAHACEALNISDKGLAQHRALDDSLLTAAVAEQLFDPQAFAPFVQRMDDAFYARLDYKPYYIQNIHSPQIDPQALHFDCPSCGRPLRLRRRERWRCSRQGFVTEMVCPPCGKSYVARTQFKQLYDRVAVKRWLKEIVPAEQQKEETCHGKEEQGQGEGQGASA